ncbi:MAG: flagellar hook protein FlgE [Acidobacteriales bacterium]|nr:flagellar hook protein FlgE [Terriglobales bacterium]
MPTFSIPLSGLTASSIALSTIANNLANLNTIGYKDSRVLFRDLFYQSLGTNGAGDAIQQGAGTAVSSIPASFTQGSVDPSGVATDVAILGDGFFVVTKNGVVSYTRAGNFEVDKNSLLVTSDGQMVMGYPAVNGVLNPGQGLTSLALGAGTISPATATANVQLRTNLDATAAVGTVYSAPVTIYDSLGASHVLMFTYTKTATNAWDYSISIPAADVGGAVDPTVLQTGSLTFDGNGNLTSPASDVAGINITGFVDGANDLTFTWKLYDPNNAGFLTQMASPSSTSSTQQDGAGSGTLVKFEIGSDGTITGAFSNGKTAILGQLALATFANNQGLLRTGNNGFSETLASGQPVIGGPGTSGRGTLAGGALELSNVDIAKEFAALIVAQRGFQANARAVTTFDEITQETINLKR